MVDDGGQQQDGEEVGDQRQSPGKLVGLKNSLGLTDLNTKKKSREIQSLKSLARRMNFLFALIARTLPYLTNLIYVTARLSSLYALGSRIMPL